MGGQGPLPGTGAKPPGQRRRRNKEEKKTELDVDARVPDAPQLEGEHKPETAKWWNRWVSAPQATMFTAPAWSRLEMLASLVDELHDPANSVTVRKQLLAEIRQNESLLLATPADQLRAKLDLRPKTDTGKPPPSAKSDAKRSADRKGRLLQVVKSDDAKAG